MSSLAEAVCYAPACLTFYFFRELSLNCCLTFQVYCPEGLFAVYKSSVCTLITSKLSTAKNYLKKEEMKKKQTANYLYVAFEILLSI